MVYRFMFENDLLEDSPQPQDPLLPDTSEQILSGDDFGIEYMERIV